MLAISGFLRLDEVFGLEEFRFLCQTRVVLPDGWPRTRSVSTSVRNELAKFRTYQDMNATFESQINCETEAHKATVS